MIDRGYQWGENINTKIEINDTFNYYNQLMDIIDNEVYMSPANYLIARNISIIYSSLIIKNLIQV